MNKEVVPTEEIKLEEVGIISSPAFIFIVETKIVMDQDNIAIEPLGIVNDFEKTDSSSLDVGSSVGIIRTDGEGKLIYGYIRSISGEC